MTLNEFINEERKIEKATGCKIDINTCTTYVGQGYYQLHTKTGVYDLPFRLTEDEEKRLFMLEYIKKFIVFLNIVDFDEYCNVFLGHIQIARMAIKEDFEVKFFSKYPQWLKYLTYNPFKTIGRR